METIVLTSTGRRMAIADYGSGDPPILLVHASGFSSSEWRKYLPLLSVGARVVTVDLLGYGKSDPVVDRSPVAAREDEDGLLNVLGLIGPSRIIGHSYGGYLAAKVALASPQLVRSLVLVEPVLFGALRQDNDAESTEELAHLYEPGFLEESFGGTERWMQRFIDYWSGEGAWARLPDPARRANMRVAWKVYCEVRDLSQDPRPFADYRVLSRLPTTLIRGSLTTVSARRIVDRLAEELPSAKTHVIEGAGHMSPLTHSNELLSILERAGHAD